MEGEARPSVARERERGAAPLGVEEAGHGEAAEIVEDPLFMGDGEVTRGLVDRDEGDQFVARSFHEELHLRVLIGGADGGDRGGAALDDVPPEIDALAEAGLRDSVKVIIGGAPVTQNYSDEIGADGYAPDAASAVDLVRGLLN